MGNTVGLRLALLASALVCLAATGPGGQSAGKAAANGPDRCARLAQVRYAGIEIVSAKHVPAGPYYASAKTSFRLPGSCRIAGVARPTPDSRIGFEVWLPDSWNGRYAQLGNGGFAGNIDEPSLANEVRRGNAAAMTDTGHKASEFDASWALGHPEKIIDYGYRSIKVTADAARLLIGGYYGRAARRRYFIGCSNGGRQALMAAQRYPNDWDGILAGSPAVGWTEQLATFAAIQHQLRGSPEAWIPVGKLPAIQKAAQAACPETAFHGKQCKLDVRRLICTAQHSTNCLTQAQAATLDLIQSGSSKARADGLSYGFEPTAAAVPSNWDRWIVNPDRSAPSELTFATQAFRYLVLGQPDWQVERFDPSRDFAYASNRKIAGHRLSEVLDADDPDLGGFMRRGGKLIIYTGWADPLVSPTAAVAYYRKVMSVFGEAKARRFARLFVVPGMQHCQGGVGPNAFGQAWVAPALRSDAAHDIRLALDAWVERGLAPGMLTAVKYNDDRHPAGVVATEQLRPYPSAAGAIMRGRQ